MTGLEFKINAYKVLNTVCSPSNPTLDALACDIYNIIEGLVVAFQQCQGAKTIALGSNIKLTDVENILKTHWDSLFASKSVQKQDINKAIGTHL